MAKIEQTYNYKDWNGILAEFKGKKVELSFCSYTFRFVQFWSLYFYNFYLSNFRLYIFNKS